MAPTLLIAWRFLRAQSRAAAMGVMGIALGVAFFVLTQAQTKGFEEFFIKTILGTNGAVRITERYQNRHDYISLQSSSGQELGDYQLSNRTYQRGVDYPEAIRAELEKIRGISGISEIVEGAGELEFSGQNFRVALNGIRLYDHLRVSALSSQIIQGSLQDFDSESLPIVIGARLAKRLQVEIGQKVMLRCGSQTAQGRLIAVFETGAGEIDLERIYLPLGPARTLLRRPFGGSVLQLALSDPENAETLAANIRTTLFYHATGWKEREKVWLDVFLALRVSSGITVCSILVIAAMGIFNTLSMMVLEKTRQISILMAMGYSGGDIRTIFLLQGAFLGALGCTAGVALGVLATAIVERLPIRIRGIFSTDHFVVSWDLSHYLLAIALAVAAVVLATLWPALRAAKLHPANVLRGGAE